MSIDEYLSSTRAYRFRESGSKPPSYDVSTRDVGNGALEATVRDTFGNLRLRTTSADELRAFLSVADPTPIPRSPWRWERMAVSP